MVSSRRIPVAEGVTLRALVDDDGSGEPVVLVHGLASNARLWDGVAAALRERGHPVAAVDLRGHGQSDKPDDGYDFATITADVTAVIEALGFEKPLVAGQSWGGNVAVELAVRRPHRIRAIACIDGGWLEPRDRFDSWEACAESLAPPRLEGTPVAEIERAIRRAHPDWTETAIAGALACFEVRADGTVSPRLSRERHMTILRHLWDHRPSQRWSDISVPVLLVPAGTGRPEPGETTWAAATRAAVARAEATLDCVHVEWIAGDHDLHAQHPARIAAMLHELVEAPA